MLITDAQVHIWAADSAARPWPAIVDASQSRAHKPQPITKDDMLREMDAAGVARAVIAPPVWEGVRNDVALAAAQAHSDRFAVMGRVDLLSPASRELIAHWREQRGMLGLRYAFHRPLIRPLLVEGRIDWLWPLAEKSGVPIMLFAAQTDLHIIDRIAERHPALKLTIDHFALTKGKDTEAFRDFDKLLALAKRANIAVKASCLPLYTTDTYPFRALHPYVRQVYDVFGPQRMFWGSDISRLPCAYRECVTMFTEEMNWLTSQDLEWIMGRAVCEWIGWKEIQHND
jgi:predicted TIM-barrel fold metal-dependent hydrolase